MSSYLTYLKDEDKVKHSNLIWIVVFSLFSTSILTLKILKLLCLGLLFQNCEILLRRSSIDCYEL
jgi:hypothetical protein